MTYVPFYEMYKTFFVCLISSLPEPLKIDKKRGIKYSRTKFCFIDDDAFDRSNCCLDGFYYARPTSIVFAFVNTDNVML